MTATEVAALAFFALMDIALVAITVDIIADKNHKKKVHKKLIEKALQNECFASEELILEADRLMHDESQTYEAIDFARRVYLIGRTAQEAKKETEEE